MKFARIIFKSSQLFDTSKTAEELINIIKSSEEGKIITVDNMSFCIESVESILELEKQEDVQVITKDQIATNIANLKRSIQWMEIALEETEWNEVKVSDIMGIIDKMIDWEKQEIAKGALEEIKAENEKIA